MIPGRNYAIINLSFYFSNYNGAAWGAASRGGCAVIRKQDRLVITFFTTADAMAMEYLCREQKADGRIIPVPRSITADCGLAWCADPQSEKDLRALMEAGKIRFQGVYRCLV